MLNLLQTLSNITSILPIKRCFYNKDVITGGIIIFDSTSSAISHLFESHKHGLWGFSTNSFISKILNNFDLFGVFSLSVRILYLWYQSDYNLNLIKNNKLLFLLFYI